jgi:translation initiation factor IF-2
VYEIAKELGVPSKDLLAKLSSMGVEAKSHSSTVTQDVADRLRSSVGGGRPARSGQSRQDQGEPRPAQGRSAKGEAGQARTG